MLLSVGTYLWGQLRGAVRRNGSFAMKVLMHHSQVHHLVSEPIFIQIFRVCPSRVITSRVLPHGRNSGLEGLNSPAHPGGHKVIPREPSVLELS